MTESNKGESKDPCSVEKLKDLRPIFLILALLGFLCINCPFLYYALIERKVFEVGMSNGLALIFISEAFLLLAFFAFLIAKTEQKKPGWIFFVCMSILGSLAFSIPLQLYLMTKPNKCEQEGVDKD